jgi:hypothetical protein
MRVFTNGFASISLFPCASSARTLAKHWNNSTGIRDGLTEGFQTEFDRERRLSSLGLIAESHQAQVPCPPGR